MSAESPRHARSGGPLTVPSQPPSDRSIIDAVSGFINDVTLASSNLDPKDIIQWARFETADINEPTREGDSDNDITPLLLILGYGSGVQVWLISPSGEAQEVLSWRQGTVRVLRILPTPQHGDCFASKRPLIALCDSASPGPTFCSLSFISIRGGEQVKSIKFKNPILDVLANKRSVVVSFSERFAVFDAATLEDRMAVTTCFPCPCPLGGSMPINPLTLGDRWLAYADKKLNQSKRSSGGCEGEGVTSYTATVLHAAKSLSKGLRGLGESVAHSLAGGRGASQSPSPPNADVQQPGVITVMDIESADEEDGQDSEEPWDPIVAHFVAHSEAIIALKFDASGMLLVTADRRGHDFHVFRINPHPCGPSLASVHHLYILHRGDTTAKVQDIAISPDSRWAAISTLRGTTHVFAISPYGGPCGVRTHTQPRVVNRLSRFHRSAGLPIHAAHAAPKRPSGSPVGDGITTGAWFPNPRLPPYPLPTTAGPMAQLRPTANLPTHTITRTSSGRQRLSSLSEDSNSVPLLARARFGPAVVGGTGSAAVGGWPAAAPVAALYLVAASGALLHLALHPRPVPGTAKEKVCDETPIEVQVETVAQWALQRPAAAADLLAPLPPANPLLRQPRAAKCADVYMSEEERWLSQVEIVTHAGPHRRLWMGPQFVFKTYNCTGSSSSLSEAETVEVDPNAARGAARSNPVNMPAARPLVPVLVDSGSASSVEHSPSDSFRRKSLLSEGGRNSSLCDVQLREDLAEAMKEDHGWSAEAEPEEEWEGDGGGGGGGGGGVARSVDPLGCVVAARAAPRPPPLDADAHTRANRDECCFRPVLRAPAALPLPTPPLRPLPRTTTIPVQPLDVPTDAYAAGDSGIYDAAEVRATGDSVSFDPQVACRCTPATTDSVSIDAPEASANSYVDLEDAISSIDVRASSRRSEDSVKLSRERTSDEASARLDEVDTRANDRTLTTRNEDTAKNSRESSARLDRADTRAVESEAAPAPRSVSVDPSDLRPSSKRSKDGVRNSRERTSDELSSARTDRADAQPVGPVAASAPRSSLTKESSPPIKINKSGASTGRDDKKSSNRKNTQSFANDRASDTELIAPEATPAPRLSQTKESSPPIKINKRGSSSGRDEKKLSNRKSTQSSAKRSVKPEPTCVDEQQPANAFIASEPIATVKEKNDRVPEEELITRYVKHEKESLMEEIKVPTVRQSFESNQFSTEPFSTKIDSENIVSSLMEELYEASKEKSWIDEEQVTTMNIQWPAVKSCVKTTQQDSGNVKLATAVSSEVKVNVPYMGKPAEAKKEKSPALIKKKEKEDKKEVIGESNSPQPVASAVKPLKWAQDEIKTEDQAWDMLMKEAEKPFIATIGQVDVKTRSKKNRKIKKVQEDTQDKMDDDNFVEIHAIEKQQLSCGELVSISSPFEDVDTCTSFVAKSKKSRSPKSFTPDKSKDYDVSVDLKPKEELSSCYKLESNLCDVDMLSGFTTSTKSVDDMKVKSKSKTLIISQSIETDTKTSSDMLRPYKSKSLSPYMEGRKSTDIPEVKDLYVIDSTQEEFPEIQITRSNKQRKRSSQLTESSVETKQLTAEKPIKSWSSIAASKNVKKVDEGKKSENDEKKYIEKPKEKSNLVKDKLDKDVDVVKGSDTITESSNEVSLQEKLYKLCRRDIMVAECDAPTELNFIEEHHLDVHELPPLEPLDFGLNDFKLDDMRDSLLEVAEEKFTSPIYKINIDDILSSIKETTNRAIESSSFNLIDLEKVPAKKEKGFSVVESHKITTQEIKLDDALKSNDREADVNEKSSDEDNASPIVTDSDKDDRKIGSSRLAIPSQKQPTKAKKSRKKKK